VIGKSVIDRRLITALVRTAAVCVAVVGCDVALRAMGPIRLAVDAVAYVGLAFAFGVVGVEEVRRFQTRLREG
jgi:hypothetical protein